MSRGGFGGAGGGRGGRGGSYGGGRRKIGGMEVPWDVDLDDVETIHGPSELFPAMQPHHAEPPTKYERTQIARYRTLRDRIHQGPLYTLLGDNVRVTKAGASRGVIYDGFEDLPSYSQRKQRVRRKIPRLDTRPYVLHLFPEELRPILDRNYTKVDDSAATKKRQNIAKTSKLNKLEELDNDEEGNLAGEDDGDDIKEDQDEGEGEPQDDEYDEDEDDDNDDYNAEQYFSTGENDDGGDDDGGHGDDYD